MRLRLLPLGLIVAVCASAAVGPTPSPWKPKQPLPPAASAAPTGKIPTMIINGVPDTGQFLPDTTWLIKVGPRVTRVQDFVKEYANAYAEYKPREDSLGRVQFMNNIIHRDLLGLTARALNRPLDFTDRATLRETEERALSDVFFLRYVVDAARPRVTEAEIGEYVSQRGAEAHFRRIVFANRDTAQRVRSALAAGRLKWDDAVRRYSLVRPTADNPNGDMGWVKRSDVPDFVGLPLFRALPGGYTEVIPNLQGGHQVSLMVERRQDPAPPKTALLAFVRHSLFSMHVSLLSDSIQSVICEDIGLSFDSTNVNFACSRFGKSLNIKREGYSTNVEVSGEVPDFAPEDTARVLVRWRGGQRYSLGQFMSWYTSMNPMVRPDVTIPDAMMGQILGVILEPYRSKLARERGLDRDPEAVSRIENKRERLMVERMYQDSVMAHVSVSRQDREAYYAKHLRDFFTYSSVDFAMIYRYNRASADSVVKALDAGAKPWDILAADSLLGEKAGSIQHLTEDQPSTYHKILFEELRPGRSTVIGSDLGGVIAVIHLINYSPGRQLSYEESQGMADESLQNIKAEEILNAWLGRLGRDYAVESRPELVMRVRLLDPSDN